MSIPAEPSVLQNEVQILNAKLHVGSGGDSGNCCDHHKDFGIFVFTGSPVLADVPTQFFNGI